jgi:putative chitinase
MRITDMIKLLEADEPQATHVVGDSHAVAIAGSVSGSVVLAKNGAAVNAIASQAQGVPDGVPVILTAGNNNVSRPQGVSASVKSIIEGLTARGCTVVYVGFPPIDLNNKNPSVTPNTPENNNGKQVVLFGANRIQEMTPEEFAAFQAEQVAAGPRAQQYTVPEKLPMNIFYRNAGYTVEYNNLIRDLIGNTSQIDRATSIAFNVNDVNPRDPMGIHATANAYARVANEAAKALTQIDSTTENPQDDQVIPAADQLSPEEFEAIDLDGNGEVTVGEYNQYAAENDIDLDGFDVPAMAGGSGLEGIFGILLSYIERSTGREISIEELQDTIRAGNYQTRDTGSIPGNAQLTTTSGNAAENGLILAARRKWANVADREVWICALIAQCRVETGNFRLNTEVWGPTATQLTYDIEGPRPSKARQLGNTAPGDGFKYRGRGWIQLTGKANYQAAASIAGADIVNNPDLAAGAAVANRTAIHYFETRVMNRTQANNIQRISRLVNGGTNGMAQRIAAFEQLMDNLTGQQPITGTALARGTDSGSLRYENQGKIRGGKLDSRLEAMLQKAAEEVGVVVHISSGGQMDRQEAIAAGAREGRDPRGSGGKAWILNGESVATGSTRHDNGKAADVQISSGGQKQPLDSRIMNSFITAFFKQPGAGGGSGDTDYMGDYTIHVDIHTGRVRTWNATPGFVSAMNTGLRGQTRTA